MRFRRLSELELRGKRVFIRADLNVPQDEAGNITDDTRIRASVPGIRLALDRGAAVMVASHLGRPKEGEFDERESLAPIARKLSELLGVQVPLLRDWLSGVEVQAGEAVMLENCRFNVGEKADDERLARKMATLCDIYVNDAFGAAHRAEATTRGMAKFAALACAGPLMAAELDALGKALASPVRPLVAIVGGSKVSSKLAILVALAKKVDQLVVGGGIANTFLLAAGRPIGKSLVDSGLVDAAREIMARTEVPLPADVIVATEASARARAMQKPALEVAQDEMILDIGPESSAELAVLLRRAGTILWNGPVGVFEIEQFSKGTATLARAIADSTAFSIAGGGETIAAINKFGVADRIGYISTAGGAFLEFLEGKSLPAVAALEERA